MNEDSLTPGPKAKTKKIIMISLVAVVLVVVLVSAALLTSGQGKKALVGGSANDLIINQSDMGSGWNASDINEMTGSELGEGGTSGAYITFDQFNSTGQLAYRIEVGLIVFESADNASLYYDNFTARDQTIDTAPALLANVSVGDGAVILDGPHITLGHEAKWIIFKDRNAVCIIAYHHAWTYDPLPNDLLVDLANKQDAKLK